MHTQNIADLTASRPHFPCGHVGKPEGWGVEIEVGAAGVGSRRGWEPCR